MKRYYCFPFVLLISFNLFSQENPKWDDVKSKDWPSECKEVSITSTTDQKEQRAFFYKSKSGTARPLIVSLHTWSGGYDQKDTLSWQCIDRDYNYIHPDFRGPNNTFEACGSPLALSDIEDAIDYAVKHASVNLNEIHITGVSGGGYATLLTYMTTKHHIKTFSAWVPISNLIDWYYESEGRKNKYSRDIALATTGLGFDDTDYHIDVEEAKKRSPVLMETPVTQRMSSKLYIYAGVHDGYTGSVPITHSINFYNKIVTDIDGAETDALISNEDIIDLLTYRGVSAVKGSLGNRDIYYQKNYKNKLQITLFDGGHERLDDIALSLIENDIGR